ncbi:MAG: hypothetical protein EZS28_007164 [Streblomastix strix]|uniref:Uncharacterized protein n=1 Tax=Streblomastix strix TaxID=222440 RepID=A0A5J4WQV9_9EUKA|nr:MAG: hypothetical protein EZS28_007164 [Streblomastix strix]
MNLNSEQIQDIIILTKVLQAAYCLTEVCTKPGGDVYAVKMNSVVQPLAHINCNVVSKATTTKQGSKITVVPGQQCSSLIALPDIAVVLKLSSVSYNLLAAISIRRPVVHTILIEKCNIIEHIQSILEQEVQMIIYQRQQVKEEESDKVNEVIDWVKNQKDADAQELNDSLSSTIGSTTSFSLSTTQLSKTDTSNASSYSKSQSMESNSSHSIVAESALRLLNSLLTDSQPLVEDTINSPEIINAAIKLLNIRTKGKTSQSIPGTGTNINYLLSCSLIQTPIKLINSNSFTYTLPSPSIQTSISVLAVLIRLLQWGEMSEKQNILKKIDIGQQLSNALYSAECTRSVRVNNNSRNNNQVDNDTDDNSEINVDIEIERGNDNLREYSLVGFIFLLRYDVNENKKIYENKSKTEYPSQTPKIPSSKAKSTTPSPSKTNITAIPAPITQASLSLTPAASFNTNTNTKNQSQTKQQQDNSQVVSPNQLKRGTPSPVPKQLSVSSPNQQNQNFTSLSPNSQQINQQQQVQSPLFIKQIIDEQIEEGGAIEEIELCQFHEYKKNILKNEQQQQQQQMQDANANVAGQNAIELISAQFKPASDKNSFDYSPCIGLKLFRLSQEVLMRMIRFAQNEVDEEVVEEEEEWNELEQSD